MNYLERPGVQARSARRRHYVRWLVLVVALGLVFLVGIAFGQALDDAPDPGGTTTSVRTLTPVPQELPARTVTVTVTQP